MRNMVVVICADYGVEVTVGIWEFQERLVNLLQLAAGMITDLDGSDRKHSLGRVYSGHDGTVIKAARGKIAGTCANI